MNITRPEPVEVIFLTIGCSFVFYFYWFTIQPIYNNETAYLNIIFNLLVSLGVIITAYWAYIIGSHFFQRHIDKKTTQKFNEYLQAGERK